ncbi:MAG: uracil-DNA glycosylase family protein [Candidatus Thorarchaeota archaeon]
MTKNESHEIYKENYKINGFRDFCSRVANCTDCFEENIMIKFYNFFDGKLDSPLFIVGQSPIYPPRPYASRPFSLISDKIQHKGSKFLRECMTKADIDYNNCYVTNLVKDSAEGNKINDEMSINCAPFLEEELKMFTGRVILVFGKKACEHFGVNPKTNEMQKTNKGKYVIGCYHPSYFMRKGDEGKQEFIEALKKVSEMINGTSEDEGIEKYLKEVK